MSQLERLARPFPDKYVKGAAPGKYGEYVPHHIVTQALLAIVGPFDLQVGEVFTNSTSGNIEGCLVTMTATVDGRRVSVTEVGDCEQPGNWKTQGARMKDAISDGVKRCAARLGCGLHLWAGADYFLYGQLHSDTSAEAGAGLADGSHESPASAPHAEVGGAGKSPAGVLESRPRTASATSEKSGAPSAPARPSAPESATVSSSPTAREGGTVAEPFSPGQASLDDAHSRAASIQAAGVDVRKARIDADLPPLAHVATEDQWLTWLALLTELGVEADALASEKAGVI